MLEVLDRNSGSNIDTPFAELYRASLRSRAQVFAEHSAFEIKDNLKAHGYRWSDASDGTEIDEDALADELHYLRSEIYRWPDAEPLIRRLTAHDRFKA